MKSRMRYKHAVLQSKWELRLYSGGGEMGILEQKSIAVIRLVGIVLLLIGVASALIGPAETYVFHLFGEGGRFHYEGFGFGSLMTQFYL